MRMLHQSMVGKGDNHFQAGKGFNPLWLRGGRCNDPRVNFMHLSRKDEDTKGSMRWWIWFRGKRKRTPQLGCVCVFFFVFFSALWAWTFRNMAQHTYCLIGQKKAKNLWVKSEGCYKNKCVRPAVDEAECKLTLALKVRVALLAVAVCWSQLNQPRLHRSTTAEAQWFIMTLLMDSLVAWRP